MKRIRRILFRRLKSIFIDSSGCWTDQYYRWIAHPQAVFTRYVVEDAAKCAKQMLDIGARHSPYTRKLRSRIVCLDKPSDSEGYLGFTQKRVHSLVKTPDRDVVFGDACALPLSEKTFDVVTCIEVIEHINKPENAVREIARVLKSTGICVITTPNGAVVPNDNPFHVRHYSMDDLHQILSRYFHHVQISSICPSWHRCHALNLMRLEVEEKHGLINIAQYAITRLLYLMFHRFDRSEGGVLVAHASKPKL